MAGADFEKFYRAHHARLVEQMVAALRRLPPRQREVLVLFHVAELPVEEIGRHLRLPVGTVKSRLARGRSALARLALPSFVDRGHGWVAVLTSGTYQSHRFLFRTGGGGTTGTDATPGR